MTATPETLSFWHGARRWDNPPVVRPPRAGRCEHGPGIYLTTAIDRAQRYAKGGGLVRVELQSDLRWLEDAARPLASLEAFLDETPRVRGREKLRADLRRAAIRHPDDHVPVSYLVNLMVNDDALVGAPGLALADWLVRQGIDASRVSQGGDETWVVVFNPAIVHRAVKTRSADIDWSTADFPSLEGQLSALAKASAKSLPQGLEEVEVSGASAVSSPRRLRP